MTTAYDHFISDLLERNSFNPATFFSDIGPGDEMYHKAILVGTPDNPGYARFKYIESGLRMYNIYKQLADYVGGFDKLGSVLDFGSGWGRLTRFLLHRIEQRQIWVSDIYADAVAWQSQKLGVNGLVSVTDPNQFALDMKYSIIFSGSVFSHLPDHLFRAWFRKLYSLLDSHGILAFSVIPPSWLAAGEYADHNLDADGKLFLRFSESSSLDKEVYGAMYVNEQYVARIASLLGIPSTRIKLWPSGLYEGQDLVVVAGAELDLSSLELMITPLGGGLWLKRSDERLTFNGWGIDLNRDHQLYEAEIFLDENSAGTVEPSLGWEHSKKYFPGAPNPAVQWSFDVELPPGIRMARVEARSSAGTEVNAYASLDALPPHT